MLQYIIEDDKTIRNNKNPIYCNLHIVQVIHHTLFFTVGSSFLAPSHNTPLLFSAVLIPGSRLYKRLSYRRLCYYVSVVIIPISPLLLSVMIILDKPELQEHALAHCNLHRVHVLKIKRSSRTQEYVSKDSFTC